MLSDPLLYIIKRLLWHLASAAEYYLEFWQSWWELGSVCYIWSTFPVSCLLSLSLGGPEPLDHASGLPATMTPCCPQSTRPCCCSSFNCSACGYGTLNCSLLFLRCCPVAPSTTTVISTRHSQKRTRHPS